MKVRRVEGYVQKGLKKIERLREQLKEERDTNVADSALSGVVHLEQKKVITILATWLAHEKVGFAIRKVSESYVKELIAEAEEEAKK